jgi:hypothetical protein
VTNLEHELKNHAVKDRNKQILSRWRRLNHDRGTGLQARTERQHRINPQRENLDQRQVGSGGIENRVTDGKTKLEKRKQINREVRKSTARSGLGEKENLVRRRRASTNTMQLTGHGRNEIQQQAKRRNKNHSTDIQKPTGENRTGQAWSAKNRWR